MPIKRRNSNLGTKKCKGNSMAQQSFRPPKMGPNPFNPQHQIREMDSINKLATPHLPPMGPQAPHVSQQPVNPMQFQRLRAMFAQGR